MTTQQSGLWEGFEVISTYSDARALEDGVLIDISGRLDPHSTRLVENARVTAGLFSRFCELSRRNYPDMDPESNATSACQLLFRAVLRKTPDADGWRKTQAVQDGEPIGEVWLIPNELGGLTLMFPSDYEPRPL